MRVFEPGKMGHGGRVTPGAGLWPRWVRALKDPRGTLRFRLWGLTGEEIRAELEPTRGPLVA